MRNEPSLVTAFAVVLSAFLFAAIVFMTPGTALADEISAAEPANITDPRFERIGWRDRVATLNAVHKALAEIPDGASYVWRRKDGELAGVVRPTSSFKSEAGSVCRHIILALSVGGYARQIEGIACRLDDGGWRLDG
jgi:hypothetical protein